MHLSHMQIGAIQRSEHRAGSRPVFGRDPELENIELDTKLNFRHRQFHLLRQTCASRLVRPVSHLRSINLDTILQSRQNYCVSPQQAAPGGLPPNIVATLA